MDRKLKIKFISLVVGLTTILLVALFITTREPFKEQNNEQEIEHQVDINDGASSTENDLEDEVLKVQLSYINNEYVITGDESLPKTIQKEMSFAVDDHLYENVVKVLMEDPLNDETVSTAFPESATLNSVEVIDNIAYVDFEKEGISNGSSLTEGLIILSLYETLIQFEEVDAIQILLDGEKEESLQGHYDISNPIEKFSL